MEPVATNEPAWRVGLGNIDLSEIYLLEIHQVSKASLQPVLSYRPDYMPYAVAADPFHYTPPPPRHGSPKLMHRQRSVRLRSSAEEMALVSSASMSPEHLRRR